MSFGELGIECNSLLELFNSRSRVPGFQEALSEKVMGFGRILMHLHGLGSQRDELVNAVQFLKPASKRVAREHVRAIKLEYPAKLLDLALHSVFTPEGEGQVKLDFYQPCPQL